jgi:glycosyltransferase involved in cell wall biosynthesis
MSYRPKLVFCGPVATMSGYGSHARDLVHSLIDMDKFDIKIMSINWGETPMNALNPNNDLDKKILDRILVGQLTEQPDVWMQCTIPNEFQQVGKYNIGITAGIETDICDVGWIEGCNKMDLVIVPSKHSKKVFEDSRFEKRDKTTHQVIEVIELKVPVEILHEGFRGEIYTPNAEMNVELTETLNGIENDFAFLFVGHWMKGDFGQDRKDVSGLLYTFFETFGDTPNQPALVLKTSGGTFSVTDRSRIMEKIDLVKRMSNKKILPPVYVLHGDLTDEQMNTLYNHPKIKAFVSFTKGEGYGRPIAEFITTGKPVIVSGWSGQVDFVDEKFQTLLKGEVKDVHPSAVWEGIINSGTKWFTVDYQNAAKKLDAVKQNYKNYLTSSKSSVKYFNKKWSYSAMVENFKNILEDKLPKFSEKVTLNLPKLRKVEV